MTRPYEFRQKPTDTQRTELKQYPEFVQDLLVARGITDAKAAELFFNPNYDAHVHDPFLLADMDKAVTRLIRAIDDGEFVAVYSDFDADGIPGGALLHDVLKKVGHERFTNYIPHRDTEGYGFHTAAVDALAQKGVTLIITVDVGIVDVATVEYAKTLGIETIVTDHHLPNGTLPQAAAVVNPQRRDETYPFKHLCGTGVAFKLTQALFTRARELEKPWIQNVPQGWEKWMLDLVAIATVSDMMPLVDENRALVYYGLLVLRKSRRSGLRALFRKLRASQAHLTEDDIGFTIGPRLNAASRMDSPEKGFELLTTDDEGRAADLASELESLNNKRKGQVASITRELKKRFAQDNEGNVLVAGNPNWNPALLGLAANSLVDAYGKTVCLWGREGTGNLKGSCRGSGSVHVVDMFEHAGDALVQFGGHEHAGGFSVDHEHVHKLEQALNDAYAKIANGTSGRTAPVVDANLKLDELHSAHRTLMQFGPFGIDNPKPLFVCQQFTVVSVRQFGKEDAHIELNISPNDSIETMRAISFFKTPQSFTRHPAENETVDVIGTLELSRFAGRVRFELRIVDVM